MKKSTSTPGRRLTSAFLFICALAFVCLSYGTLRAPILNRDGREGATPAYLRAGINPLPAHALTNSTDAQKANTASRQNRVRVPQAHQAALLPGHLSVQNSRARISSLDGDAKTFYRSFSLSKQPARAPPGVA